MKQYDVIVIGGGASGMMAAGRAGERGKQVLLLEKNPFLGVKLSITGGGRCNICNAQQDVHQLLSHYGKAKRFLYSSFSQFGVPETFAFFESRKLPLKIEANNRAFPKTEKASDVVKVLSRYIKKGFVEVRVQTEVLGIKHKSDTLVIIETSRGTVSAHSLIIATGGKSHPETGSTGNGFSWLSRLRISVERPTPSVVPLAVKEHWIKSLAGITLENIGCHFFVDKTKRFTVRGNILCTHFGLSGPTILNAAKRVDDLLHEGTVTARIDLFPSLDEGALDRHIVVVFNKQKNKEVKNALKELVPHGSSQAILELVGENIGEKKVHSMTKTERKKLAITLKNLPVTITGLMGFERAVVADGGVDIKEIDGKTMRLRKYPNIYVTGDMLHINRPSGGYSLQLCWTTGWVAGNSVF